MGPYPTLHAHGWMSGSSILVEVQLTQATGSSRDSREGRNMNALINLNGSIMGMWPVAPGWQKEGPQQYLPPHHDELTNDDDGEDDDGSDGDNDG